MHLTIYKLGFLCIFFVIILRQAEARTFIVGTKEAAPFAMEEPDGTWTGISIDLWDKIARELDITYKLRKFENLQELIEAVEKRQIDIAVAALTITAEREKAFDFTHPFYTTGLSIAVAKKGKQTFLLDMVMRVFSLNFLKAITTLAIVLLLFGLLIWFFERKYNTEQFSKNWIKGIGAGFWWSAVTMTTVGYGDKAPQTLMGRLIAIVWMFAGIIVISGFTAAIASSLTVSHLHSPINGPDDLADVRVGTIKGSTSEAYLKDRRISYVSYMSIDEGLQAIITDDIDAMVYDLPIIRYFIRKQYINKIGVIPQTFKHQQYGIALPAQSPYRERINQVLLDKIYSPLWKDILFKYLGE
jgi:polar amino acid transport system substrate-binding protein